MRVLWAGLFSLALTATGQAGPVPAPPDGFAGAQYVDGKGCVYQREGSDWTERRDKAGAAICGFPPTLSSRRTDPEADRILPASDPAPPPGPEELLVDQLSAGLRQGEFLADPAPPEPRREPDLIGPPAPLQADLVRLAAQHAALRSALRGAGETESDLCALLGYRPDNNPAPILGRDVTQGLCPGMRAPLPQERVSEGGAPPMRKAEAEAAPAPENKTADHAEQHPNAMVASAPPAAASPAAARPPAPAPMAETAQAEPAPPAASVIARRDRPAPPASPPQVELIPATARYVQVGTYRDDANAVLAIRRLSDLGYPVVQQRRPEADHQTRTIMAGPFTDRRSLISALNRLRDSGYPKAVAR